MKRFRFRVLDPWWILTWLGISAAGLFGVYKFGHDLIWMALMFVGYVVVWLLMDWR